MNSVKLTVNGRLSAVAAALVVAAWSITLTGSDGVPLSASIDPSTFTPDEDGNFSTDVKIDGVPDGSFSGSVQAVDSAGMNIGLPATFSGSVTSTPDNLQPIPVSVVVQV